jgi:hypothetical protein
VGLKEKARLGLLGIGKKRDQRTNQHIKCETRAMPRHAGIGATGDIQARTRCATKTPFTHGDSNDAERSCYCEFHSAVTVNVDSVLMIINCKRSFHPADMPFKAKDSLIRSPQGSKEPYQRQ